MRTAMRAAADIDDVGCPGPAAGAEGQGPTPGRAASPPGGRPSAWSSSSRTLPGWLRQGPLEVERFAQLDLANDVGTCDDAHEGPIVDHRDLLEVSPRERPPGPLERALRADRDHTVAAAHDLGHGRARPAPPRHPLDVAEGGHRRQGAALSHR